MPRRQDDVAVLVGMPAIRAAVDRMRDAAVGPSEGWPARVWRALLQPTLGDLAVGRDNNLNLLRFVAASLVLFSHCYPLTGHIADEPLALATRVSDFGLVGVTIFFAISGFLITQSVVRASSMGSFVKSRALRLLPALILATTFTVFVIGPVVTDLPQSAYWRDPQTWSYLLRTIALDPQVYLPGVFKHVAYAGGVNGSLWTIPVEAMCYVVAGLAALLGLLRRRWLFSLALIGAYFCFSHFEAPLRTALPKGDAYTAPYLVATFLFGAWCFLYRTWIPLSWCAAIAVAIGAVLLVNSSLAAWGFYGGIAYLALYLAYNPGLRAAWFLKLGDYSYGIYVFAFPVQQFVVWSLNVTNPLALFALAFPPTLALAALSWHWVEKPALALKSRT